MEFEKEEIVEYIRTQIVKKMSDIFTYDFFKKNMDVIKEVLTAYENPTKSKEIG